MKRLKANYNEISDHIKSPDTDSADIEQASCKILHMKSEIFLFEVWRMQTICFISYSK